MAFQKNAQGFTNMGEGHYPRHPVYLILEDRMDNTPWTIQRVFHSATGKERIVLKDTLPARVFRAEVRRYKAYEEPILIPGIRLIVRGGRLGFAIEAPNGLSHPPNLAREGLSGIIAAITLGSGYTLENANDVGLLAFEVETL